MPTAMIPMNTTSRGSQGKDEVSSGVSDWVYVRTTITLVVFPALTSTLLLTGEYPSFVNCIVWVPAAMSLKVSGASPTYRESRETFTFSGDEVTLMDPLAAGVTLTDGVAVAPADACARALSCATFT